MTKRPRVLLITNLFAPDELAGASLYSDMALYFAEQGYETRVLSTFSYYPAWKRRAEDRGKLVSDESWNGIPLRRVSMYIPRRPGGLSRIVSDISFFFSILAGNFRDGWVPDVVVTACPMFSQCLAQRFLYPGRRIPRLIIVQDFVVDAALELKILRPAEAFQFLRHIERWALRSAETLTTISIPMLNKLQALVGADRRTCYIPNWIHSTLKAAIEKVRLGSGERAPRRFFYSGNLGVKQGLADFVADFESFSHDWTFHIHGDGANRDLLLSAIKDPSRVELKPVLAEADYAKALLECSACVITQAGDVGANFLPSKLLPALIAGTPVLAVCDAGSPLAVEVTRGEFGVVIPPKDVEALKATISRWTESPETLKKYSQNALIWAQQFDRAKILDQFRAEISTLLE